MTSIARRRRTRRRPTVASSAVPTTMKAAVVTAFGDASVLAIRAVPVPRPGAQDVLIAVDVAGVGSWDPKIRSGEWTDEVGTKLPMIPGIDGAGTVVAAGAQVTRLAAGDRVYAYSFANSKGGFCAEYVAVPAGRVARVPGGLDAIAAGALPAIGLTALQGIDEALEVQAGETVLIHGASGNVGLIAIQFAKHRGARVLAVASGQDGVELTRRLGADEAIDGKSEDIVAAARHLAPDGIDAVLALVGGKQLTRCLDTLKRGGRLAYPNGIEPEPRRRRGLRVRSYDAEAGVRQFERLNAAIEESRLEVPIAAVFPLDEIARAHERVERSHLLGKVVLRVRT